MPQHKIPSHETETVWRIPSIFLLKTSLLTSITPLPKSLQIKRTESFSEKLAGYHEFPNSIQKIAHFPWFQHKASSQCSGKGFGIKWTWVQMWDLGKVTWFLWVMISSSSRQSVEFRRVSSSDWHRVGLLHWLSSCLSAFPPTVPQEPGSSESSLKTEIWK